MHCVINEMVNIMKLIEASYPRAMVFDCNFPSVWLSVSQQVYQDSQLVLSKKTDACLDKTLFVCQALSEQDSTCLCYSFTHLQQSMLLSVTVVVLGNNRKWMANEHERVRAGSGSRHALRNPAALYLPPL